MGTVMGIGVRKSAASSDGVGVSSMDLCIVLERRDSETPNASSNSVLSIGSGSSPGSGM